MKNQAEGRLNIVYSEKIALPAEFLSTLNSFSKFSKVCWSTMLSKEGSLWSVISIYSISEISEAALDNDRALVLLDGGWEKEWQLVLLLTEMESGKYAVEGLCDVWPKMKNKTFQINCFKILNECLKIRTTSPPNLEQLSTCNRVYKKMNFDYHPSDLPQFANPKLLFLCHKEHFWVIFL